MSVREYIGARYVPLFANPIEWDNTKTYEPLTIVYYQGNSYTSRQAVPTGIAITNETYWALTGNYNAQIEAYREEVQEVSIDIADINSILPASEFSENYTVKDAIDEVGGDGSVTTSKLANGAVTTAKLANNSVTNDKIANNSINGSKIIDETIGFAKLLNGVIRSIEDYGCDSTLADNTEFMQAALDDAAGKYILVVPAKKYNFTSPIVIPWNTTLIGVDRYESTLYFQNCNGLTVGEDDKGYYTAINVRIDNLHIQGNYDYNFYNPPSSPQVNGITGFFSNSCFSNINIDHFYRGVNFLPVSWSPASDYNYYNNLYGDQRLVENINVAWCYYGIFCTQPDVFFNNVSIMHINYEAARFNSSHVCNVHAWDVPYLYFMNGCTAVGIEIESINPPWDAGNNGFTSFESPIYLEPGDNNIIIEGLWIWNVDLTTTYTGFNHPFIRTGGSGNGKITITGLNIGAMPQSATSAPKRLINANPTNSCSGVYLEGVVNQKLAACAAGDFIPSDSKNVVFNILCNPSLWSGTPSVSGGSKKVSVVAI